jgi:hypothetical protein
VPLLDGGAVQTPQNALDDDSFADRLRPGFDDLKTVFQEFDFRFRQGDIEWDGPFALFAGLRYCQRCWFCCGWSIHDIRMPLGGSSVR